jgi:hypothetical protein
MLKNSITPCCFCVHTASHINKIEEESFNGMIGEGEVTEVVSSIDSV